MLGLNFSGFKLFLVFNTYCTFKKYCFIMLGLNFNRFRLFLVFKTYCTFKKKLPHHIYIKFHLI